jgi:sugar phosphate isomerase/epimerase
MKLASHNWMRPEAIERTLARLGETGYDAIEISGEPERFKPDETRKLLEKNRLFCWGSVSIMIGGRDLISEKEEVRASSLKYCLDTVDLIAGLGGTVFCLVPAEVGRVTPRNTPQQEWAWAVDNIKRVNDHCRKKKVTLGLEPINRFETNFLNRHDQALLLAKEVGDDVGVVLDSYHINQEERDPLQAILTTGKKLVDFHIADTNRYPPGQGHWDWAKLVGTLRKAGYDGCLTNEFVIPFDRTPINKTLKIDTAAAAGASAADLKFIQDHGSVPMPDAEYTAAMRATVQFMRKLIG